MLNRKTAMRESSTQRIFKSALSECAAKGLYGAVLSNIAAGAGISKGLLSQRFGSRENLFNETVRYFLSLFNPFDCTDGSTEQVLKRTADIIRTAAAGSDLMNLLCVLCRSEWIPDGCIQYLRDWYESCRALSGRGEEGGFDRFWTVIQTAGSTILGFLRTRQDPPSRAVFFSLLNIEDDNTYPCRDAMASLVEDYNFICRIYPSGHQLITYRMRGHIRELYENTDSRDNEFDRMDQVFRGLLHPDDLPLYDELIARIHNAASLPVGDISRMEFRALFNGKPRYFRVKCVIRRDPEPVAIIGLLDREEAIRDDLLRVRLDMMRTEHEKEARALQIMTELTGEYEGIIYVDILGDHLADDSRLFRVDSRFTDTIPGWTREHSFHNRLEKIYEYVVHPDDKARFYEETRRERILEGIADGNSYYVEFRTLIGGKVGHYQMKFLSNRQPDEKIKGFVVGLHDIDREVNRTREERKAADIISVLSNEYTAVYYVDHENNKYDILYQLDHVKQSVNRMLNHFPGYTDAFLAYVEMLVHPDDKDLMRREVNLIPSHLEHQKSFRVEFRRNYGGEYLYTEMKCVKVGEAEDKLTSFVVGFAENDREYRAQLDQKKQLEQAVLERSDELYKKNLVLSRINDDIIELWGNLTEARDLDSGKHIRRVKDISRIVARHVMKEWPEYNLTPDAVELIASASALHDIGKIMIPDTILLKNGRLTDEEMAIMRTHCEKGCEMLKHAPADWSSSYLKISFDICRYHHEKYDGKGYPMGLKGDSIPISAQIVSLADCLEALISKRVYKDAYTPEKAYQMILNGECGMFSDKMLHSFRSSWQELLSLIYDGADTDTQRSETAISTASLSWTHILLVDDNEASRNIDRDILESEGALITTASSGNEAFSIFAASEVNAFDAILMDVMMPEPDGVATTAMIRDLNRADAQSIPIIAITTQADDQDMNRCLAGGMDSYMSKPLSISRFTRVLYECLQSRTNALDNAVNKAEALAAARLEEALGSSGISGFYSRYELLCYINGNNNNVSGYKASKALQKIINNISLRLPSNRRLDLIFRRIIPESDFKSFLMDTDRRKVTEYLEHHASYQIFVPVRIEESNALYRLMIKPDPLNHGCFMLGLFNADDESVEDLRMRELVQRLAESYVAVDYVDLEQDFYRRYQSRFDHEHSSGRYSDLLKEYIARNVHPEDREMLTAACSPDALRSRLLMNKRISMRYRFIGGSTPRYYEIQFVNTEGDDNARFVILTLSDIDDIVRKEIMSTRLMQDTRQIPNESDPLSGYDTLSGARNLSAYTDAISRLTESVNNTAHPRFGVVAVDINDLQQINSTFGHSIGDLCIRSCCNILTSVFAGSVVYRMGGDEFTVLLTGEDYERREALMEELFRRESAARMLPDYAGGKTSFSAGLGVYDAMSKDTVADVIRKADIAMYTRKLTKP